MLRCANGILFKAILSATLLFLILVLIYFPDIPSGAFVVDDLSLINIPQVANPFSFSLFKTWFTIGYHVDFYPVRDIIYWLQVHWFGADIDILSGTVFRFFSLLLMSFIFFVVSMLLMLLELPTNMALAIVFLYALHPIHAETLMWIGAQKDLLVLFFSSLSAYFTIRLVKYPKTVWAILSFLFFILSVGSKASALGMPVLLLIYFILYRKEISSPSRQKLIILISAETVLSFLAWRVQSYQYSEVTDMRYFYPWSMRIQASAAALGRELTGLIYPPVNTVDVENWGNWLNSNIEYLVPGIVVWLLFLSVGLWSVIRFHKKLILGLSGFALLYLPTAGLLFPHRNFYSVRYLEPVFLFAIIFFSCNWSEKLRKHFSKRLQIGIFLSLFVTFLISSFFQAKYWESPIEITMRALSFSPHRISLITKAYTAFKQADRWGRNSPEQKVTMDKLAREIKASCYDDLDKQKSKDDECMLAWGIAVGGRDKTLAQGITQSQASAALLGEISTLNPFFLKRAKAENLAYRALEDGDEITRSQATEWIASINSNSDSFGRFEQIALLCLAKDENGARQLLKYFWDKDLIQKRLNTKTVGRAWTLGKRQDLIVRFRRCFSL